MEIISMIMSGLALWAASVTLAITVREKKRSEKQKTVTADCIRAECKAAQKEITDYVNSEISPIKEAVAQLKEGLIPDYEEQKKAIDSINSFSMGLNNIMGYDPFEARERMRNREAE